MISTWIPACLLSLLTVFSSVSRGENAPEQPPPSWAVSGDVKIDGTGLAQSGKKPGAAELKDTGSDNYIFSGNIVLSEQASSLILSIGGASAAKAGDAEAPAYRIKWDPRKKQYSLGNKTPGDQAPDVSKPIPFTVTV